jgi:hypothetical protein
MFDFNQFLQANRKNFRLPRLTTPTGVTLSVQASSFHYCTPRTDNAVVYTHVEVGFPSAVVPELLSYAETDTEPTNTVYGWVPVELVNTLMNTPV